MKRTKSIIQAMGVSLVLLISGCATTGSASQTNSAFGFTNYGLTLVDYLNELPGVTASKNEVLIGPARSFRITGRDPLIYIDDLKMGRDFSQVNRMVNANDLISVEVIKGNDASIYGSEGGNGVIIIHTKNAL